MENRPYKIQFTPLSYEDLDETDTYISKVLLSPQAAVSLMDEIQRAIRQLQQFPHMGSV